MGDPLNVLDHERTNEMGQNIWKEREAEEWINGAGGGGNEENITQSTGNRQKEMKKED
jgi:hypothetical protein